MDKTKKEIVMEIMILQKMIDRSQDAAEVMGLIDDMYKLKQEYMRLPK